VLGEGVMSGRSSDRKVVVFGAGAAGKGLIGVLFAQVGYQIIFVDINEDLVHKLQQAGRYEVVIHRLDGQREDRTVQDFRILPAADREPVALAMLDADFVLTAVFAANLPDVAQTLALGVEQCRRSGRRSPLHCIACENMKKSSSTLRRHVEAILGPEDRLYLEEVLAFPDCMINRVVPSPIDPLHVETEDYCEWTADAAAVKGPLPATLPFIEWVSNQQARLDRKLMVYNGSHAACAYFGFQRGHTWIHEAVADPAVAALVRGTNDELADVIQRVHGFTGAEMAAYKRDFWLRCENKGLRDKIVRIARQPARKLGRHDRLIAPAKLAQELGLSRDHILRAIWAALTYRHEDDPESLALAQQVRQQGWRRTLCQVGELATDDPLLDELEAVANE
jgi:mannitol-1-phosphate 5-dehydrogenase